MDGVHMTYCGYCGTAALVGGMDYENVRYCDERCQSRGRLLLLSHQLPDALVQQQVQDAHQGRCPTCGVPGPIDVHPSYRVWSALVVTRWGHTPHVSCRSCGVKACLKDAAFSIVCGS